MNRTAWGALVVLGCAVSGSTGPAMAVTVVLRAVQVNDTPITPTDSVTIQPGDIVVSEAYISGWDENEPGGRLKTYQLTVDGLGSYWSGDSGSLLPAGMDFFGGAVPCHFLSDCPPVFNSCHIGGQCALSCNSDSHCPSSHPRCHFSGLCVGADHDPEAYSFVDQEHPEHLFAGHLVVCAVRHAPFEFTAGCATFYTGVPDDGEEHYAATFAFEASNDACGPFTVLFQTEPDFYDSFIIFDSGASYLIDTAPPLEVNVACPPVGACCLQGGACENLPQAACGQRPGEWHATNLCGDSGLTCPRILLGRNPWTAR